MSQFKVGDWVRHIKNNQLVFKVDGIYEEYFSCEWSWCSDYNDFKFWEPQVNEWCWFWDNCTPHRPNLRQFSNIEEENDGTIFYKDNQKNEYTNCEPFINSLPSHLKELNV